jgi:glycosyltransferase involved in cell wall biosynthesis
LVVAAGHELHIVTVSKQVERDGEFTRDGARIHVLRVPNVPRAALLYQLDRRRIGQQLRRIQPALVHGFGTESSFGYSAVSSGFPSVLMIQGIVAKIAQARDGAGVLRQAGRFVSERAERATIRRATAVICETEFAAGFVRAINPRAAIHRIATPIRDAWFDIGRTVPPAPEILFVGWVVPAKGVEHLVAAFGAIANHIPSATLHIVGARDAGYDERVLRPAVERFGIAGRVQFHGHLTADGVMQRISTASLLALPTLMDTAPNVLAEARAAGVPVVASAVGGVPELIDDGVDGLLVPPASADALASAMLKLLKDPAAAAAMGERGRQRVLRDHRASAQVAKLLDVYRQVTQA